MFKAVEVEIAGVKAELGGLRREVAARHATRKRETEGVAERLDEMIAHQRWQNGLIADLRLWQNRAIGAVAALAVAVPLLDPGVRDGLAGLLR